MCISIIRSSRFQGLPCGAGDDMGILKEEGETHFAKWKSLLTQLNALQSLVGTSE
jgi:hypothetical protein